MATYYCAATFGFAVGDAVDGAVSSRRRPAPTPSLHLHHVDRPADIAVVFPGKPVRKGSVDFTVPSLVQLDDEDVAADFSWTGSTRPCRATMIAFL